MKFDLRETAQNHRIVVAHRGASGGNIPCNTIAAYEVALKQGADMIEVDLNCSVDNILFIFHPHMEQPHLRKYVNLSRLPYKLVEKYNYVNMDDTPTQFGICSFDDVLENFKGRCYINIDKFWSNPEKIYKAVKRHNMIDQVLVKSKPSDKVFSVLENIAPEIPFMPIISNNHDCHNILMKRNINYVGVEALFKDDNSYLASSEFIKKMHRDNILVWVNAIIYDYHDQLCAGHSDDTSLTVSENDGWGWLADRGFDVIQTDWTMMLIDYLKKTNRYYK